MPQYGICYDEHKTKLLFLNTKMKPNTIKKKTQFQKNKEFYLKESTTKNKPFLCPKKRPSSININKRSLFHPHSISSKIHNQTHTHKLRKASRRTTTTQRDRSNPLPSNPPHDNPDLIFFNKSSETCNETDSSRNETMAA